MKERDSCWRERLYLITGVSAVWILLLAMLLALGNPQSTKWSYMIQRYYLGDGKELAIPQWYTGTWVQRAENGEIYELVLAEDGKLSGGSIFIKSGQFCVLRCRELKDQTWVEVWFGKDGQIQKIPYVFVDEEEYVQRSVFDRRYDGSIHEFRSDPKENLQPKDPYTKHSKKESAPSSNNDHTQGDGNSNNEW